MTAWSRCGPFERGILASQIDLDAVARGGGTLVRLSEDSLRYLPDSLLTTKTDKEGKTLWTRPVCPHPQVARYDGKGDPKDAASFACAAP